MAAKLLLATAFVWAILVGCASAHAGTAAERFEPLRVAVECQSPSRTKACPQFINGIIESSAFFLLSPRATAQVVLYVNALAIGNDDRIHLRFVGRVAGAPADVEVDVDLSTRTVDDEQMARLSAAFMRGVAAYAAAIAPDAVRVEISTPKRTEPIAAITSPWGASLSLLGNGSWTEDYKSARANADARVFRLDRISRHTLRVGGSGGLTRRPPIVVGERDVSLDTNEWSIDASVTSSRHLSADWAVQLSTWASRRDPKGQLRHQAGASVGVERDLFPSDDPRGNVVAAAYVLSLRYDDLNFPNELQQTRALYPWNRVAVAARVRRDTTTFGLDLTGGFEIDHPRWRNSIGVAPSIEWQLGDHVDLSVELSISRRTVPAPVIPDDDLEALGRAGYAEPLLVEGGLSLKLHLDPTNGVRNNRFENI